MSLIKKPRPPDNGGFQSFFTMYDKKGDGSHVSYSIPTIHSATGKHPSDMTTRRKQQKLRNSAMKFLPMYRPFALLFGFFVLAVIHMILIMTHLEYQIHPNNALTKPKFIFQMPSGNTTVKQESSSHDNIALRDLETDAGRVGTLAEEFSNMPLRQLTFDDLEIGKYIGHGAINVVAHVKLPDWWFEQEQEQQRNQLQTNKSQPSPPPTHSKYVIKLAAGDWRVDSGNRECHALEELNKDSRRAKKLNILPAVFTARNFTNPFCADHERKIPSSFPKRYVKRLRTEPHLVVIVVPYYGHRYLAKPSQWVDNLADVKYFLQTLLQTLDYAHSLGINNMDISGSNVKIDVYGRALILDWNANQAQGKPIFDELANTWITAPEGLLERSGLQNSNSVLQTSISAMDIWSVGVMLTNLVYYPCYWVNPRGLGLHHSQISEDQYRTEFPKHYGLLRAMLSRIGGESTIPVGNARVLNLAELVDLDRAEILKREFDLPLYQSNATCQETKFEMLEGVPQSEIDEIHSFLKSAMKISPAERPTAKQLLEHTFLREKKPKGVIPEEKRKKDGVIYDVSLDDMEVGDYIGHGMINIVAFVEFPEWWYQQHNVNKKEQKFVMKMAPGDEWYTSQGDRECDVLEKLNKNETLARKYNIIPNVFCQRRARNPFFRNPDRPLPSSFPLKHQKRLRREAKMAAVVVPYFAFETAGDWCDDLDDVRLFISSLLETLDYSHSLGINNFDLSSSNVKINPNGQAVVMDWNANKKQGQNIYDPMANPRITAPEGLLDHGLVQEDQILQTSISAMDVWSVGTMLADLVFDPCWWITRDDIDVTNSAIRGNYDYIRAMLLEIGGDSLIPIGNNKTLDLANLVGLSRADVLNRTFNLPIYDEEDSCKRKDFAMLKGVPKEEIDSLHSFLAMTMKIAPNERPTASEMLQHPFLTEVVSTSQEGNQGEMQSNGELAQIVANAPLHYLDIGVPDVNDAIDGEKRQLALDDIEIGKYIGRGAVNIVSQALLPDWWHKQNKVSMEELFVLKLAAGSDWYTKQGDRECGVFEILSRNQTLAKKQNIIEPVFMSRTTLNPWRTKSKHIPRKFPVQLAERLRKAKNVVAIVLPYMDLDYIQDLESFQDIRYFIRSLLRTLEYSHSLGINNFDLSDTNVRINDDGEAVVMDWNANKKQGEDIFDPVANLWLTAPEGMIEHGPLGETILQTSISAMDIWSVGIMLVYLMYRPCEWVNPLVSHLRDEYPRNYHLLRATVQSVGGESRIPIGNHQEIDLAELVGLRREDVVKKEWKMPLYHSKTKRECDADDTEHFFKKHSVKGKDLINMRSFLESMMKLSPAERPNASTLLKHPFMVFPDDK